MRKLATNYGGKCLSEKYINMSSKLRWECKSGHQWDSVPASIKFGGSWCPVCAGTQKSTIREMQAVARERGGMCLSEKYINTDSKLLWKCKFGHKWQAIPASIKRGYWCPKCAGMQKCTIEEMHNIAKQRGGKCLSDEYTNTHTKIRWQCKFGHQWEAVPSSIKSGGKWCPTCGGTKKGTIEEMQKIAKERGGECLSKTYVNGNTKLRWQCREGHQWVAVPRSIKHQKAWCPNCAKEK